MQSVNRLIEHFKPTHYNLSLELERQARRFSGTVTIEGEMASSAEEIILHAKDLEIHEALIDGSSAHWQLAEQDELHITSDTLRPGKHIVVLGFSGQITDSMHGLYPCYFQHEGEKKELLATQFESHHAREVFPCVDEPEAKATFDLTLTTEPNVTVLANMPVASQQQQDGKLVTSFETTPRMSSYLLAWVVGELHARSAKTSAGVEVNVWATPAQTPESLDFALDHAVKSIEFFDQYFGAPYPLPKSDHVALPDFSSGAMENWGLITYREIALLADPATTTVASRQYIATVISHELSHQWFGNLVTMRWWNDLWLNESFATLMEYVAVDAIHPEWQAWLDFASNESILALRRDAIDGVQPVRVPVNHPDEISTLFDGAIVYAKGARLMRMVWHYVGDDAFRAGLRSYFAEFAYQNTEAADLWDHLSKASGKDVARLMDVWLNQSGYPVVHVRDDSLSQEQFFIGPHQPSQQLWPIPLAAESVDAPELLETKNLNLPIASDERLNVGDYSHFLTSYQPEHLARLLERLRRGEFSELDRLQLLHEQTLLARGGLLESSELIGLLEAYAEETSESVFSIIALTLGELKKFVEDDEAAENALRNLSGNLARPLYERLGWHKIAGEPESDTKLRATVLGMMVYSESYDVLAKVDELYQDAPLESLDPELRSLLLSSVVRRDPSVELANQLLEAYKQSTSADLREDICAGLTSVRDPHQIDLVLSHLTDAEYVRSQDIFRWFVYLIRNKYARTQTWQWMKDNWDWVETTFAGDKSYDDFPRYAASGLSSRQQLEQYRQFFMPKRQIPALKRTIDLGILEITGRVELLERDGAAVRHRLKLEK